MKQYDNMHIKICVLLIAGQTWVRKCLFLVSLLVFLLLLKTTENQDYGMALKLIGRDYSRRTNWLRLFNHSYTDCSLLTAMFQDVRFRIRFKFSPKVETIEGREIKQKPWLCRPQQVPFLSVSSCKPYATTDSEYNTWLHEIFYTIKRK